MRTRRGPCDYFQGDQFSVENSSRMRDTARVLGSFITQPGMPIRDQVRGDSGHCSLAALWSKDTGQARSRRFRIDAWQFAPVLAFFCTGGALCVPRGTSHRDEFVWGVRGMSLTNTTSRTKPTPKPKTTPRKQQRTSLKEQKVWIRGPTKQ